MQRRWRHVEHDVFSLHGVLEAESEKRALLLTGKQVWGSLLSLAEQKRLVHIPRRAEKPGETMTFRDMVCSSCLKPVPWASCSQQCCWGGWPPIPEVSFFCQHLWHPPPSFVLAPSSPAGICGLEMGCQMPTIVILKCPMSSPPHGLFPSTQAGRLPAENTRDATCLVF